LSIFFPLPINEFDLLVFAIAAHHALPILFALDPLSGVDTTVAVLENSFAMLFIILEGS
jgi:hypothetical protein